MIKILASWLKLKGENQTKRYENFSTIIKSFEKSKAEIYRFYVNKKIIKIQTFTSRSLNSSTVSCHFQCRLSDWNQIRLAALWSSNQEFSLKIYLLMSYHNLPGDKHSISLQDLKVFIYWFWWVMWPLTASKYIFLILSK